MNDRELLELAARAAGAKWIDDCWPEDLPGLILDFGKGTTSWNPLADDGDALRLAVKLELEISFTGAFKPFATVTNHEGGVGADEHITNDPCASVRRAVVRTAAEMAR